MNELTEEEINKVFTAAELLRMPWHCDEAMTYPEADGSLRWMVIASPDMPYLPETVCVCDSYEAAQAIVALKDMLIEITGAIEDLASLRVVEMFMPTERSLQLQVLITKANSMVTR